MVTVLVGPSRERFHLHRAILLPGFGDIMERSGDQPDFLEIHEDIADIFGSICEYLYTGDYCIFCGVEALKTSCSAHDPSVGGHESDNGFSDRKTSNTKPPTLAGDFHQFGSNFPEQKNDSVSKNNNIMSLHLRLHVFAEKHRIFPLSAISFRNFLRMFTDIPMTGRQIDEITDIVRLAQRQI